jgi:hypothetical protein
MAQEYFDKLHEAVKQAESRGQRFDEKGNLLTSPKGAQGEMQVMPKTARKPGYGVTPAQDKSPDELARVGKDYLKAMLDKYGDTEKALIAYNWGPKNADDWLAAGADPAKLPKETQGYIKRVTGSLKPVVPEAKAPAEPTPAEEMMTKALGQNIAKAPTGLGTGYQAALALSFLDQEKEDDDEKDSGTSAADLMAQHKSVNHFANLDVSYSSPFEQPQRFAIGGTVGSPTAVTSGADREYLNQMKAYNSAATNYQKNATAYYGMLRDSEGNPIIGSMLSGAPAGASYMGFFGGSPANSLHDISGVSGYNQPVYQSTGDRFRSTTIGGQSVDKADPRYEAARQWAASNNLNPATLGYFTQNIEAITPSGRVAYVTAYDYNKGKDWGTQMKAPTAPTTPVNPVTGKEYSADEATARVALIKKNLVNKQTALNVAQDPASYGLSMTPIFKEGGEVQTSAEDLAQLMPNMEEESPPPFMGFKSAHKQTIGNRDLENMMMGLGTDSATLGINLSKMRQDDKENLAQSLMAAYRQQMGDVSLNANMIRPVDAPPGVYMGALNAGIPVGNRNQLMVGINGMRTPDESRITGYNVGYSGEVGPGRLNVMMGQPKGNASDRNYQLQYQIPLRANGGPVYRADGSPMGGENVDHLTPQEIERMAAAQGPAFVTPSSGRGRTAGPISRALASGEAYPAVARGVAETPYNIVGAPVDIATLAMRPFGYTEEKPMMGSEWIKEKMTKLGIRPGEETDPTLKGFRTAGELGASVVNPGPVAAKVGQATEKGAAMVGKEAARQVLRGMEGEGPLKSVSPPIMYAVKPRGGTIASSGSLNEPALSKFDELLSDYATALKDKYGSPSAENDINAFIDKKARKYFANEFGTANDPLRQSMSSGEMPIYGKDAENFPEYLLAAARDPNAPGHLQAKRHLEKFYDEKTNIELQALNLAPDQFDADARKLFYKKMDDFNRKQQERMTAEGLPAEYQNPPYLNKYDFEDLRNYPSSTKMMNEMVERGKQGTLPSNLKWALQNEEPMYVMSQPSMDFLKPKVLAETISSIPPEKLKNMSFEQAVIEGTKNMRVYREYDNAVERASKNLSVPKEVVSMFTKPVVKSDAGEWVQLTDPVATKLEGKLMHHSVGGYAENPNYNLGGPEAFKSGKANVFSLRGNKTGMPEVTVEVEKLSDGDWAVNQIKGDYNSFPSHRSEDVFKFLEKNESKIKSIKSEYYPKDNTGAELPKAINVDWKNSYEHWKSGMPGEWRIQHSTDRSDSYLYTLPEGNPVNRAKGGMIERNKSDNRKYL